MSPWPGDEYDDDDEGPDFDGDDDSDAQSLDEALELSLSQEEGEPIE